MRLSSSVPVGWLYSVIWELNPITFSLISRLKPMTTAIEASITATERATAVTDTRMAGELLRPSVESESLLAMNKLKFMTQN